MVWVWTGSDRQSLKMGEEVEVCFPPTQNHEVRSMMISIHLKSSSRGGAFKDEHEKKHPEAYATIVRTRETPRANKGEPPVCVARNPKEEPGSTTQVRKLPPCKATTFQGFTNPNNPAQLDKPRTPGQQPSNPRRILVPQDDPRSASETQSPWRLEGAPQ